MSVVANVWLTLQNGEYKMPAPTVVFPYHFSPLRLANIYSLYNSPPSF